SKASERSDSPLACSYLRAGGVAEVVDGAGIAPYRIPLARTSEGLLRLTPRGLGGQARSPRSPHARPAEPSRSTSAADCGAGAARSRHGGWAMGAKSAVMLAWLATSYAVLMFAHVQAWQAALLSISIGLAMAGVGFSVMHDANHGGTSSSARMNAILSFTLDL